jgi:hypothetical protein
MLWPAFRKIAMKANIAIAAPPLSSIADDARPASVSVAIA